MINKDRNFEIMLSFNIKSVKNFFNSFVAYANLEYIGQYQTNDKHYMLLVTYFNFALKLMQFAQQSKEPEENLTTLREIIENLPYVSQRITLTRNPITQELLIIKAKHIDDSLTFEFKSSGFSFLDQIMGSNKFGDIAYIALYILYKYMHTIIPFTKNNDTYYYRLQQFLLLFFYLDYKNMSDKELSNHCVESATHFFTYDEIQ